MREALVFGQTRPLTQPAAEPAHSMNHAVLHTLDARYANGRDTGATAYAVDPIDGGLMASWCATFSSAAVTENHRRLDGAMQRSVRLLDHTRRRQPRMGTWCHVMAPNTAV